MRLLKGSHRKQEKRISRMSTAITLTTIQKPAVIEFFLQDIRKYGHEDIEIIIVGDEKTPAETNEYCQALDRKYSIPISYFDLTFQQKYLRRFHCLSEHIPFNSFSRRNIGDLYAYENGFSKIIRIDDDNFPCSEDFIGCHSIVSRENQYEIISSDSGWFNVCEELLDRDSVPFYPRGFPYSKRWKDAQIRREKKEVTVLLNAGLWLGDPDVDAITRLAKPIDAIEYKKTYGNNFVLDIETWCPINTQNTAYSREIIPAAFISPYAGRYDDIWSGYLLRKIMDHLGDYVAYGLPLLKQKRNKHNLWKDLELEMNGNQFTDHLIDCLKNLDLSENDYLSCYYELAEKLNQTITENREVFTKLTEGMKIWVEAISKVQSEKETFYELLA